MRTCLVLSALALAACNSPSLQGADAPPAADPTPVVTLDPTPPPPPAAATTVDDFDTTTAEDRAAALAASAPAGETRLGTTIASLGSPADPGIWIETPYVTELTAGRVEVAATGKSINIELRPSGGVAGSGSQISLPAMRLLDLPLTGLPELVVYRL